ncbi:hypothetical protein LTR62_008428 [Meristemomyces frigidus]|uniref:Pre-mRNA-splicing factor SPF27 n=1 Tax=Meristemomyces frigidus TaxID=1508187 RepID=A0AAN7T9X1_9PEZI|nr:hypothetical protein LTR62_008428 [Meristemomyces frigidus]
MSEDTSELHPMIPAMREAKFSDLIESEHARLASGASKDPSTGIDMTRYDAPEAPTTGSFTQSWSSTLEQAYTSAEYLRGRKINLGLLEAYGKNAWLVCNSQLEDELASLEKDLEAMKNEVEATEQARQAVQANAAGEMGSLGESWRVGIGRMIEAQAAGAGLRGEILERKRMAAR